MPAACIKIHVSILIMKTNIMNPDKTSLSKSSLILIQIVCNVGYQSSFADGQVDKILVTGRKGLRV